MDLELLASMWFIININTRGVLDEHCTHRLTDESFSITNLDLAVQPHRGHLLQALETEGVELEHGAAVFGVLEYSHSVVRRAAVGKWRGYWSNMVLHV